MIEQTPSSHGDALRGVRCRRPDKLSVDEVLSFVEACARISELVEALMDGLAMRGASEFAAGEAELLFLWGTGGTTIPMYTIYAQ